LRIYNLLGGEIATLVDGEKEAGEYEMQWTAQGLPSGIYLVKLQTGDAVQTRKVVLQR